MRRPLLLLTAVCAAAAFVIASVPAEAQDRARTRIIVQPKSYLDPGTKVKPGEAHYHRYAFPLEAEFPSYGPYISGSGSYGASRGPLLRIFETGGF